MSAFTVALRGAGEESESQAQAAVGTHYSLYTFAEVVFMHESKEKTQKAHADFVLHPTACDVLAVRTALTNAADASQFALVKQFTECELYVRTRTHKEQQQTVLRWRALASASSNNNITVDVFLDEHMSNMQFVAHPHMLGYLLAVTGHYQLAPCSKDTRFTASHRLRVPRGTLHAGATTGVDTCDTLQNLQDLAQPRTPAQILRNVRDTLAMHIDVSDDDKSMRVKALQALGVSNASALTALTDDQVATPSLLSRMCTCVYVCVRVCGTALPDRGANAGCR